MTWYAYAHGPIDLGRTASGEWYHGSGADFDRFDLDKDKPHAGPKHWNSHLGVHFTSEHGTAWGLATDGGSGDATIYHCSLAMKHPQHYHSEFDLDRNAHHFAKYHPDFQDNLDGWGTGDNVLRKHPQVKELAAAYREHLKSLGYDGITYGNEYEGSHLHECAIAFHPDDITIEHAHPSHDSCDAKDEECDGCGLHYPHGESGSCSSCGGTFGPHKDSIYTGALTRHFAATPLSPLDPDKVNRHRDLMRVHVMEHHPDLLGQPEAMHDALHRAAHTGEGRGWGAENRVDQGLEFHDHHPLIDPSVSKTKRLAREAMATQDSLESVADDGYCTDEWRRWQQGKCMTYAHALMKTKPGLRFGVLGQTEKGGGDASEGWRISHFFAHDDQHAYDSAGRHPMPYRGIHQGENDYAEHDSQPEWWGDPEDEEGATKQDHQDAADHIRRNGILEGRYGPHATKQAVLTYSGGHGSAEDRLEGHSRRGPGMDRPDGVRRDARPDRGLGRRGTLLRGGAAQPGGVTWHPKAQKDLKSLDKPVQKQILAAIDGIASGDQATMAQTHPLTGPLKGWTATKASRGHRITHQTQPDGTLYIGHIGLHTYDDAIRRLTMTMPRPDPDPVEYRHVPITRHPSESDERNGGFHAINAYHDGKQVGSLSWWDPEEGPHKESMPARIDQAEVASTHRRRGLAAEMFRRANEITPGIQHSDKLTGDGRTWRDAVAPEEAGKPAYPMRYQHRLGMKTAIKGFSPEDRQPQHPDESFGISDHTTRVPPEILVPYRDKDAAAQPRDPERMEALRKDVAQHGIGNPLALFHDGKRATLAEGNHRLSIALEQQHESVPLRVIRLNSLSEVSNFAKGSVPITKDLRPHLSPPRKQATKDEDVQEILDLIGGNRPKPPNPADHEHEADEAERMRKIDEDWKAHVKKHQAWQAARPGINPGEDIGSHEMGKSYPHAEWVPIGVAQHFRDHHGDQHHGSAAIVDDLTEQLRSGRGMTDPLMLLHHNEDGRAHLGEGNHRLAAAERAGWTHVPMRVVRMYDGESQDGKGRQVPYAWRSGLMGRTPEMAKPSEVFHLPSLGKEARTRTTHAGPDGEPPTGIMVAIVPPKRVSKDLEIPDGEPQDRLHVTLAYLGNISDYSAEMRQDLPEIVAAWAETQPKTTARTQGAGTFVPTTEDGKHVVWAAVDIPGVNRMHRSLTDMLKDRGYQPHEDHEFHPHLTLGYSKYHWRFIPKIRPDSWRVREVWTVVGGTWESHPLG